MQKDFESEVAKLRTRFQKGEQSLLKPEYHKHIPADGFSIYAKGIWEAVEANKDLDLPTQQELLAQFRCDEIAVQCNLIFDKLIIEVERSKDDIIPELGSILQSAYKTTLDSFDAEASRYHQGVYQKKRSELQSTIEPRLEKLYRRQLSALRQSIVSSYNTRLQDQLRTGPVEDFPRISAEGIAASKQSFEQQAATYSVEGLSLSSAADIRILHEELAQTADKARSDIEERILSKQEKHLTERSQEIVTSAFAALNPDVYDKIRHEYIGTELAAATADITTVLKHLQSDEKKMQSLIERLGTAAKSSLIDSLKSETSTRHLVLRLREYFEKLFKFDNDLPRIWKTGDDIERHYKQAREETLALLPILAKFSFSEDDEVTLIKTNDQADLATRLNENFASLYIDAKRSIVSTVASIPLFMYGLLLVLGWNELMALLRNPLYFLTIAFVILIGYAIYTLNLTTPVEQIARAMFDTTLKIIKEKLRAALEVVPEATNTRPQSGEDVELDDLKPKKER